MKASPVTARSVCIGLLLGILVNLFLLYNDYYLRNTPLIFHQLPVAGMAILLVLIAANTVARRAFGRDWLGQGEMLMVWAMIGIAGGIGSTGFGRAVTGFAASPAYYANAGNEYAAYLVARLPDWMLVSKDPDSKALRWYFEGLPRGECIPWRAWLVPMAAWGAFGLAFCAAMLAMTAVFFRRWADQERLVFPIAAVPLEMTRPAPQGRLLNDLLRNPVTWVGAFLPVTAHLVNGLRSYVPTLPAVPLRWWFGRMGSDRPWSEFWLGDAGIFFSLVGLTFMMTSEMSFSLWFFYVAYRLSFALVAMLGAGAGGGYFGNWNSNVVHMQASGAALAVAAFLVWSARDSITGMARCALRGEAGPPGSLMGPRTTLAFLAIGAGGMAAWTAMAGAQWWAAAAGMLLFLSVVLVLSRLVAEAGLLIIGTEAIAYEFLQGLVPASWLTGKTITVYSQLRGAMMSDLREILMPYALNGARAIEAAGARTGRIMAVFAVTAVIALGTTVYARIATCYKYGALQGDTAYNLGWNGWLHYNATAVQKNPPPFEYVAAGEVKLAPVGVAHATTGAGITGALIALRAWLPWWPLNPIGYVVCGSWAMSVSWFSIFIGWMAKTSVMTFGGATVYRRVLPAFIGMVLGEGIIGSFWAIVSFFTGVPGVSMLPSL